MNKSRRNIIKGASGLFAGAITGSAIAKSTMETTVFENIDINNNEDLLWAVTPRSRENYARRVKAAGANLLDTINQQPQPVNNDESELTNYFGSFSKTLAHDSLGLVDESAYLALKNAVNNGDFSNVSLSSQADRKLTNPSAYRSFELHGGHADATRIAASPATQSAHAAAEMVEVYWQAFTRDISFSEYQSSNIISAAVSDLNNTSYFIGAPDDGVFSTENLFRGSTYGDNIGPYISQFLYLPFNYGASQIEQKYAQPVANIDHMTSFDDFLAIQNGAAPSSSQPYGAKRYIQNNRDLANYVHSDVLFQAYYNSAMILLQTGGLVTENTPFSNDAVEGGFVTFGGPDILNMVASAARMALTGAWYQKWLHRKLRPEAFAGLVDVQLNGLASFGIHSDLTNSEVVDRTIVKQGNALLSQAYPEGSPTHPAYPAGHACVSGACTTILKAWFNEDAILPNPVAPNQSGDSLDSLNLDLTVLGELNKLANNIAIGRNASGVHYRSDGEQGMIAGEQQAIAMLRDYSITYFNEFYGFDLTKFNGQKIRIKNGKVIEI